MADVLPEDAVLYDLAADPADHKDNSTDNDPSPTYTHMLPAQLLNFSDPADVSFYLAQHLGAPHLPFAAIVPISALYAVIFAVGVFGNAVAIVVIAKNKYMQTTTNVFLANLALADLLTHLIGRLEMMYLFRPEQFRTPHLGTI